MNSQRPNPSLTRALCMLLAFGLGLAGAPLHAAKSNATPPPGPSGADRRWDNSSLLQPVPEPQGILGDMTAWEGHTDPKEGLILEWHALDIESGYLFTATGQGMQIFNVSGDNPGFLSYIYGWISGGAFPIWNYSDKDWYIKQIDAPEGNSNLVALTMEEQGFAIVNTSNKIAPKVAYQREVLVYRLYAFKAGGTNYAYATGKNGVIYLFNLDAAPTAGPTCVEQPPAAGCAGVYVGQIQGFGSGASSIAGTGTFLATASQSRTGSVGLWNVAVPGSPTKIVDIPGGSQSVALWRVGSSYYLARIDNTGKQLLTYDVSCIAAGSCPNGVTQLWSGQVSSTNVMQYVTASVDGASSYLYIGADDLGIGTCVPQREFVYDVTQPASPAELTPKIHADGYWGWYYGNCSTGYNLVGPRIAKVYNNRLYRAAMSVLDVHKINKSGPPVADFSWTPTEEIYAETATSPGTEVQFNDLSSGLPTSWTWVFSDGAPVGGTTTASSNPKVVFSSTGEKTVSLIVGKGGEVSPVKSHPVTVLDPAPVVEGIDISPAAPKVCQPVTFTPVKAKGAPTLNYAWVILDANGADVPGATGSGQPYEWKTASTDPQIPVPAGGNYTAKLTLSNSADSVVKTAAFTLTAPPALPIDKQFTPTFDPFTAGTVKFHVDTPGATEWSWDFDGDGVFEAWTDDPVKGPNPSFTYVTTGVRQVRVKVRNCLDLAGRESLPVEVEIKVITPLKALFAVSGGVTCFQPNDCTGTVGNAVNFADSSTGAERYDYDWDGNGSWDEVDKTAPVFSHTYTAAGTFYPKLRVRRGASEEKIYPSTETEKIKLKIDPATPPPPGGIAVSGPTSGQPNAALSFSAAGTGSCNPSSTGWSWSSTGGTITNGTASSVTISWASEGAKIITVTNSACSGVSGSKSVQIGSVGPTPLKADFTYAPAAPVANQAVSFNGGISTGNPTSYTWDFGDSSPFGTGAQVSHTYTKAGSYKVRLSVTRPGSCPPAPFCDNTTIKTVVVGTGEPPLGAAFTTNATCVAELGLNVCTAAKGQQVSFTDQSTGGPTSWSWDFGDGGTSTGNATSHTFTKPGSYAVTLTVTRGATTASVTRTFNITGTPEPVTSTIVLPWIAQSRGTLVQSSDLYVYNPGTVPMEIVLEFRKRGLPEVSPPKATRTIQPGATLYVADVLKELFNWENIVGFVTVTRTKGDADPVMTSFNTTFKDGAQYGQTVPGVALSQEAAAPSTTGRRVQYLVGLNDNGEREAYFGVTNPNSAPATYRLKFFDALGQPIGNPSAELKLSSYGLKQFQPAEIRSLFGLNTQDDYRVEVETISGGQLFPYGANVRSASDDPSFLGVGSSSSAKVYLIGALSTPGLNNTLWQTDLVLANTGAQVALTDVTFTKAGLNDPTQPLKVTLQPGETQRLENLVAAQWNIRDSVGVLTIDSDAPNSVFPIVQGESYNNANPAVRFGQFMAAFTDAEAAGQGQAHYLVGLRQDTSSRTTYWVFNPGTQQATYDLIYRALDGTELGRITDVKLGAGKLRQISPSQHPLPATGAPGGSFTVQVAVRTGKALSAAQVVNNQTNDPAYVQGQAQ